MRVRLPLAGLLLFVPSPALAEVADKEPTTFQLWLVAAIITAVAFALAAKRPSYALFLLPVSLFFAWGSVMELRDPFVGPVIRAELGDAYFIHGYLAAATWIAGPIIAWAAFRFHRARNERQPWRKEK